MSTRRLAEKQPENFTFTPENANGSKPRSPNIRRAASIGGDPGTVAGAEAG